MAIAQNFNVVLLDDDAMRQERMVSALSLAGHCVIGLDCAESMEDETGMMPIDLLVICLGRACADGFDLIRRLRAAQPFVGIVAYSGDQLHASRLQTYASGADIFLEGTVAQEELLAAVRAIARRLQVYRTLDGGRESGLSLDQCSLQLSGEKGRVCLSAAESTILTALARAPGHRLDTWQINELLGVNLGERSKSNLEVRIVRLRNKLSRIGANQPCIRAIRLLGYQLCVPLQVI